MSGDPQLEDHLVGVELQIVELVEQRKRATVQHDTAEAERIQAEIDTLQAELASTAERLTSDD
jgi:hypothetical protein